MIDATQTMVKNKLGLTGQQVYLYKLIYDFISRFAFIQAGGKNIYSKDYALYDIKIKYKGSMQSIPHKTREILDKIGTTKLHLYFSPHEYPTKFENFCKKMLEKKAQIKDYYVNGLIVVNKLDVEVLEYEDRGVNGNE